MIAQYSFIIVESLNSQASGGASVENGRNFGRQIAAARAAGNTTEVERLRRQASHRGSRLTGATTLGGREVPNGRENRMRAVGAAVNTEARTAAGLPPRSGTTPNPSGTPPPGGGTPTNANPGYWAGMKNKVGTYGGAMAVGAGIGALVNGIRGWRKGKGFLRSAIGGAMTGMGVGMAGRFIGNRLTPNTPTPHGTT